MLFLSLAAGLFSLVTDRPSRSVPHAAAPKTD